MNLFELTLVVIYLIWSVCSIITIIKRPKDLFLSDLDGDDLTMSTNWWIVLTIIITFIISLIYIPWGMKLF